MCPSGQLSGNRYHCCTDHSKVCVCVCVCVRGGGWGWVGGCVGRWVGRRGKIKRRAAEKVVKWRLSRACGRIPKSMCVVVASGRQHAPPPVVVLGEVERYSAGH